MPTTKVLRRAVSRRLPDFPWDRLADAKARAHAHPGGIVDLSIGTPVDPTPEVVQHALCAAADSPGYPSTAGTPELRDAAVGWLRRRFGIDGVDTVLPAIGSKELIAGLAVHLGVGAGDTIVIPALAYPTYEVGAALAGAKVVASDSTAALGPEAPALIWLNSPSNPTGRVLPADHLRKVVDWARERGTLVVSDECYLEFTWDGERPASVLDDAVCGGSHEGVLAVHSASKRSNLAGYRGGFVAGDPAVVAELLDVRKNLGLMMPGPQQAALAAALDDDAHVDEQHTRYARRRSLLLEAFEVAGFGIDDSQGALYLWASRDEPCMDTVGWLAERGILVAPGDFYGAAGSRHVRIAFTAVDERVAAVAERL
ncbi:MAG: succinyldiaminopimelate transaminase [Nocardioidaceae bacterium]